MQTLGYGIIRFYGSRNNMDNFFWNIAPLYARTEAVAEHLFAKLVLLGRSVMPGLRRTANTSLPIHAHSKVLIHCKKYNLHH
jgi:hypothetical protein